ncbi:MAG: signal transduction histidine kinase [Planctomycetota bacterium]|jgi:signal transduction histidine kinase
MTRPPSAGPARTKLRIPLRVSVLGIVALINLVIFGAGFVSLSNSVREQREDLAQSYSELLGVRLQSLLDSEGELWSAGLLRWDRWDLFQDVLIAHFPGLTGGGETRTGVMLNPLGTAERRPDFDEELVLASLAEAARVGRSVPVAGGLALPVPYPDGLPWGGAWVVTAGNFDVEPRATQLFWYLISTALMTLFTVAALQRLVLDPVQGLAAASRRITAGDLSARVEESKRGDELAELCRGFNTMASTVENYQSRLEQEVLEATLAATQAEQAAMTQRRLAATGELAAGVAHEINNPLGGMLNAVESLERGGLPEERRKRYLHLVRGGLGRIGDTVGQLLRLAPRETLTVPLSLAEPLGDALGLVRHRAQLAGVKFLLVKDFDPQPEVPGLAQKLYGELPMVRGQANELGQAILNLLVNALDALEERNDAEITVELEQQSGRLHLCVRDNGPGADADTLERACDLFFTTKDQGKGTGLGLAHVYSVVAGHGGEVRLSSEAGSYFQAELWLPIAEEGAR